MQMDNQSPIKDIPPMVAAIFAAIIAIEIAFTLGTMGVFGIGGNAWRITSIEDYAFTPRVLELFHLGYWSPGLLVRFISYPFVHASFTHAVFAGVLWLALGKFVAGAYAPWQVLVIFMSSVICGALAYGLYGLAFSQGYPLLGAYPGVFGMIGAFTYLSWLRLGQAGGNQFAAFSMILTLMIIHLVYSVLFGGDPTWIAELTGFVIGGLAAILMAPGGWSSILAKLRDR